jgi:hypothetical protein
MTRLRIAQAENVSSRHVGERKCVECPRKRQDPVTKSSPSHSRPIREREKEEKSDRQFRNVEMRIMTRQSKLAIGYDKLKHEVVIASNYLATR